MQILRCKIIYYGNKKEKKDFSVTYFSTEKKNRFFYLIESIDRLDLYIE